MAIRSLLSLCVALPLVGCFDKEAWDKEDGEIAIAKQSLAKYKAHVRAKWSAKQSLTSSELVRNWRRYLLGWWGYFKLAKEVLGSLSAWTRRHVRKCFWQRWHSRRGRLRNLRMLGVTQEQIRRTNCYAGAWKAARQPAMHKGLNNSTLRRYGILTPDVLAAR